MKIKYISTDLAHINITISNNAPSQAGQFKISIKFKLCYELSLLLTLTRRILLPLHAGHINILPFVIFMSIFSIVISIKSFLLSIAFVAIWHIKSFFDLF